MTFRNTGNASKSKKTSEAIWTGSRRPRISRTIRRTWAPSTTRLTPVRRSLPQERSPPTLRRAEEQQVSSEASKVTCIQIHTYIHTRYIQYVWETAISIKTVSVCDIKVGERSKLTPRRPEPRRPQWSWLSLRVRWFRLHKSCKVRIIIKKQRNDGYDYDRSMKINENKKKKILRSFSYVPFFFLSLHWKEFFLSLVFLYSLLFSPEEWKVCTFLKVFYSSLYTLIWWHVCTFSPII